MKQVLINLYSFSELDKKAQQRAIYEHAEFMASIPMQIENEDGEMIEEYDENLEESDVIENIEANEYIFFEDGELAHCVTYTGGHPKTGTTELNFHGRIYDITK